MGIAQRRNPGNGPFHGVLHGDPATTQPGPMGIERMAAVMVILCNERNSGGFSRDIHGDYVLEAIVNCQTKKIKQGTTGRQAALTTERFRFPGRRQLTRGCED